MWNMKKKAKYAKKKTKKKKGWSTLYALTTPKSIEPGKAAEPAVRQALIDKGVRFPAPPKSDEEAKERLALLGTRLEITVRLAKKLPKASVLEDYDRRYTVFHSEIEAIRKLRTELPSPQLIPLPADWQHFRVLLDWQEDALKKFDQFLQNLSKPMDKKEVAWNSNDPNYISGKEAVELARKTRPGFKYKDLNRALKPDGPMHYMPNPDRKARGPGSVQCKVHKGDLITWRKGRKRVATGNRRLGKDNISESADNNTDLYEKGFAEGRPEGYDQGYEAVKERRRYYCQPPFPDATDNPYVHGRYEGWKKGYPEGRLDSDNGEPQKHGALE